MNGGVPTRDRHGRVPTNGITLIENELGNKIVEQDRENIVEGSINPSQKNAMQKQVRATLLVTCCAHRVLLQVSAMLLVPCSCSGFLAFSGGHTQVLRVNTGWMAGCQQIECNTA